MRATIKTPDGSIRDPRQAFDQAIRERRLSTNMLFSLIYAGDYMYMYHDHAGRAHFKHRDTRRYLP